MFETYHTPVLLKESIAMLFVKPDSICVDATFGGGGHSRHILSQLGDNGHLIAFDRDADAIANAPQDRRLTMVRSNYRFVHNHCKALGFPEVDCILADLGVSSHQFDTPERGFSFRFDAPLDMRMNQESKTTAKDVINSRSEEELANILYQYGELDDSRRIAKLICKIREEKPIETTGDLESILSNIPQYGAKSKYLAKVYQALRIEVNQELRSLELFLQQSYKLLKQGGRIAIITYHSLEDRIVKNFLKETVDSESGESLLKGGKNQMFELINRKPILPSTEEMEENPRSRSAKLRGAIKL